MTDPSFVSRLASFPREWDGKVAYSSSLGRLSFAALRDDLRRLATWLRTETGLGADDRVAVCLPKSLEAITAHFAVLYAGGVFVPLQHLGPAPRLAALLGAIAPRLLITDRATAAQLRQEPDAIGLPPTVEIEAAPDGRGFEALLAAIAPAREPAAARPEALASIVFTSGSSGTPKGVMLSHRNIEINVDWMARADEIVPSDARFSQMPLQYRQSFLYHPVTTGSRIHLLTDRETMFPALIAELMAREGITVWASTPTALRLLIESGELGRHDLSRIRLVKSHGESPSVVALRVAMDFFPKARFTTSYGSTEALSITHLEVPRPLPEGLEALPLGRICREFRMLLCDEAGREVAAGEVGEICAIGEGVTLGYWKDPELTASKRLDSRPDSFRTGDLALRGADGEFHFMGRKDRVVKLRGHRLDLGEVEAVLKRHAAVREAVVFAVPGEGEDMDVAAAVLAPPQPAIEAELKRLCAAHLPRLAWPARILVLADFPLLAGRKIDRQKLRRMLESEGEPAAAG